MQGTDPTEVVNWLDKLSHSNIEPFKFTQGMKPFHVASCALIRDDGESLISSLPQEIQKEHNTIQLYTELLKEEGQCQHLAGTLAKFLDGNPIQGSVSLDIMLNELLANAFKHGKGDHGILGLVCAQKWPQQGLAQVTIADLGVGIRETLINNQSLHPQLEKVNACELACQYGITGKPGQQSGYGLNIANQLMINYGGQLTVISGHELYSSKIGGIHRTDKPYWQGTFILLEWPLNDEGNSHL